MKVLFLLISLTITSCGTIDVSDVWRMGKIITNESKVEGTKEVTLLPNFSYPIKGMFYNQFIGARKITKDGKSTYLLTFETEGARTFRSVTLKLDGKKYTLKFKLSESNIKTDGPIAHTGGMIKNYSHVHKIVDKSLIEKIANAKVGFVRYDFLKEYSESSITLKESSKEWQKIWKDEMKEHYTELQSSFKSFLKN